MSTLTSEADQHAIQVSLSAVKGYPRPGQARSHRKMCRVSLNTSDPRVLRAEMNKSRQQQRHASSKPETRWWRHLLYILGTPALHTRSLPGATSVAAAMSWTCFSSIYLFLLGLILLGGESPYSMYVLLIFPFSADLDSQSTSFFISGRL